MLGNYLQVNNSLCRINFNYVPLNDEDIIIAHCTIYKWNKTTKPIIIKIIKELAEKQTLPIYVIHDGLDKKHFKFITMCGFKFSGLETYSYGKRGFLFKWSKE